MKKLIVKKFEEEKEDELQQKELHDENQILDSDRKDSISQKSINLEIQKIGLYG